MTTLQVARYLHPGGTWSGPATLTIAQGRIAAITQGADTPRPGTLTPGLVDLHNNGAFGTDFATGTASDWHRTLAALARHGVTAVQPTIITAPLPHLLATLHRIAAFAPGLAAHPIARILGVHLEGPFLSPAYPGAHNPAWLQDPTPEAIDALLPHTPLLRTITLAPERPGALPAIARLAAAGLVVALGHSDADAATTTQAADAGATMVTHLFNAMRPFRHRDPALPGAALTDSRLTCGLIADLQHVDPIACRLAFQAAPGRIAAVTDSILVAGLPPGTPLHFGGAPVTADPTGLGRRPDGTISGAGILLDEAIRRLVRIGIPPEAALHAATEVPADAIARPGLGRIAPGAQADLVLWDDAWHPTTTWLAGTPLP